MNFWTRSILAAGVVAAAFVPTAAGAGVGDLLVAPTRLARDGRIVARAPQGLADGEYRVHMLFRAIPPATPVVQPTGEQPKGVQFQLTPVYGVTIPVIIRLGNLEASAGIANVQLERRDGGAAVGFDLTRTGTR